MEIVDSDVLIIGGGIAGLRAALEVTGRGKRPLLVSKSPLGKANNTYLSGGAFTFATEKFSLDKHFERTIQSGQKINDRSLVQAFVKGAPSQVQELQEMGLRGRPYVSGLTTQISTLLGGPEITRTLVKSCRETGVPYMEGIVITDLITGGATCYGAIGFQRQTGTFYGFRSRAVLLATGGAGAIYGQNDNAPGITGDGYALAMEAGLDLKDMEFVQFYPLVYGASGKARIIIPPKFADLGKITNRLGEDLKEKYGLHQRPLAIVARDRFSRALFQEIVEGRGIDGTLLLDMRDVDESQIPLGESLKALFRKRIGYREKPVKIAPSCHHTMGGVDIDDACQTKIKGLFAAGEVVGGIHGANRMGGNALPESLVFGNLAARSAVEYAQLNPPKADFGTLAEEACQVRSGPLSAKGKKSSNVRDLMRTLRQVLWEKVGIIRDERTLKEGMEKIGWVLEALKGARAASPQELLRITECRNGALTGMAIAVSALKRTESRGSHYRADFPEVDDAWVKHIHVRMTDGLPAVEGTAPVLG